MRLLKQYLHNSALKLPSGRENRAKPNTECLLQTEENRWKKKEEKEFIILLSNLFLQLHDLDAPFKEALISTLTVYTGKT